LNRIMTSSPCLSIIFSESVSTLFLIMLRLSFPLKNGGCLRIFL
jgi:hypothetical protein